MKDEYDGHATPSLSGDDQRKPLGGPTSSTVVSERRRFRPRRRDGTEHGREGRGGTCGGETRVTGHDQYTTRDCGVFMCTLSFMLG